MRYHMHAFCVDFYALSVITCKLATCTCTSNNTCIVTIILVKFLSQKQVLVRRGGGILENRRGLKT